MYICTWFEKKIWKHQILVAFLENLNFMKPISNIWVCLYNKKAQTLEGNLGQTSHCDDADDGFYKDYFLGFEKKVWKRKQFSTYNVDCMDVHSFKQRLTHHLPFQTR